jgi:ATP-binding cassette, subfamily B, multidrug efflux pump
LFKLNLSPVREPQKLSSYLRREWMVLAMVTVTGILFNGSMSFAAVLQGRLIDAVVNRLEISAVLIKALTFVGVVASIQLMRVLKRYFVRLFALRTGASMRQMLYNSVFSRDISVLSELSAGDLMNKAVGDVDICVEGMRKVITEIFDTGVLMLSYLITMFIYDSKTTLISCMFIPAAMFIAEKLKTVIERCTKQTRIQSGIVSSITLSDVENALLYRVNSADERKSAEYEKELRELEALSIRADVLENSMQPIYNAVSLIGIVGIIVLGGKNVVSNIWSIGDFTAYTAIFIALSTKAGKAAKLFNTYQKAAVSWKRIQPGFEQYRLPAENTCDNKQNADLNCHKLGFSYAGASSCVFEDLSFTAKAGDIIGVTGEVASGKTALGLALTGLFPFEGEALLCGKNLSEYSPCERSRIISYMGHDPQLLSDTIYENITLGEGGDISAVLDLVSFGEDLNSMPEGENTVIGSAGIRLSGGQRARIALARALYRNSKLVILDDPFSAVDMETERRIIENIRRSFADRIIILISHRLSVFPQTEKILFFENGSVIFSSHADLLENNKAYRKLWETQIGGEQIEKQ